jgi:L-ascorbate metabolism protein UlaG (beta-lactamase superfamily)
MTTSRPHTILAAAFLLGTMGPAASRYEELQPNADGVTITFLANEGVMLSSGRRKVLIDALFLKYGREYAVPADSTQASLQRARAPFDSVDVLLVTHRHGDHFHPVPMAAHLRANPRATLLTSQQVIDSLRGQLSAEDLRSSRIMSRTTAPGMRRRESIAGITVELLGLPHGGRRHRIVEHLGYVVEIGNRRVLHVGDTDVSEANFAPFRLDTARIDVALIPMWAVTDDDGRRVIERWIRPKQVVAFHLGTDDTDDAARDIRAAMPNAVTFSRSLETYRR